MINEGGERSETPIEKIRISGLDEPPPGADVASVHDPLTGGILSPRGTVGPR